MKPLLIFAVLLMLGAMFLIGEHPEYNPFTTADTNVTSTGDVIKDATAKEDAHMGEN